MDDGHSRSADPRRSLELLWGRQEPGRRGPKPRLSVDALVDAAIAIADAEGLAALSMRRVADAVGLSPMSLYTYVPSKAELVDLMFDRALGATAAPGPEITGWRARLAFLARERWTLVERHPWVLDLSLHRPPLGPSMLRNAEAIYRSFEGLGLTYEEIGRSAETLQNYVNGALQAARQARTAEAETGLTDEEWLAIVGPVIESHLNPDIYPALADAAANKRKPPTRTPQERLDAFEFGLERVLDGLDAFIRNRA